MQGEVPMEITCPSGLVVTLRGLRGKEVDILSDETSVRKGDVFDRILRACITSVEDPGPYTLVGEKLDTSNVLTCDRDYILTNIRIATYGNIYSVPLECPSVVCRAKFHWDVNLNELDVVDLEPPTIASIKEGKNLFEVRVGDDTFGYKLMTGKDEILAMKRMRKAKRSLATTAVALRVVYVNGKQMSAQQLQAYFDDYEGPIAALLEAFNEIDGGVDNDIEAECPECFERFDLKLPLDAKEYWIAPKRSRLTTDKKQKPDRTRRKVGVA